MRLQDLTKAELIAIIHELEKNRLCERYVNSVLIDAQKNLEYAAIEESEKASSEYIAILGEYNDTLAPCKGCKLTDIPQETWDKLTDISKRLHEAEKKRHAADVRYTKIAGI